MKKLSEALKRMSLSTVLGMLYHHGLKGHSERKKSLFQKHKKKEARSQFADAINLVLLETGN